MNGNGSLPVGKPVGEALGPLTAITVTYNSADVLDDFLDSVRMQQGAWRLIIVDNASSDATRDRLARIGDERITLILNDVNVGFAAGSNAGIRRALDDGAGSILLINNDTVFEPDLFATLESTLAETGADAISPVIVFDHDPRMIWYAGGHLDWGRGLKVIHEHFEQDVDRAGTTAIETSFCPACCMLFTRSAFERVGLFDEDFFVYCEDVELCHRMTVAGLTIMVTPDVRIRHKASFLTGGMASDFSVFEQHKNRVIMLRKTCGPIYTGYSIAKIAGVALRHFGLKAGAGKAIGLRLRALRAGATYPITGRRH